MVEGGDQFWLVTSLQQNPSAVLKGYIKANKMTSFFSFSLSYLEGWMLQQRSISYMSLE